MKILITGAKGFLGKELSSYFESHDHELILADRTILDPTKYNEVKNFFHQNEIDIVMHTAAKGGKRNHADHVNDMFTNLTMFQNLNCFSHKYKLMFNFGSGASFDRSRTIENVSEEQLSESIPDDFYGLSKNRIARYIVDQNNNVYNLRLFGCFGIHEEPQRLIHSCYKNFKNNENAVINQDKYMDYFYAQDVGRVIDFIISNSGSPVPRDINLCYTGKYKLSDYANKIKRLTNSDSSVIIYNKELTKPYTGSGERLKSLNIDLVGLNKGIEECLKSWSKS
tara:strand:- start:4 stop:846 length:843 start_codon:yes stop_codon:yes gene_type:complete